MHFTIKVRALGVDSETTNMHIIKSSQYVAQLLNNNVKFSMAKPMIIGGIQGFTFTSDDLQDEQSTEGTHGIYWTTFFNGCSYELLLKGPASDKEKVAETASMLFQNFAILDRNKKTYSPGKELLGRYTSPDYSYILDLTDEEWLRVLNQEEAGQYFDLTATKGTNTVTVSVYNHLDGKPDAQLPINALVDIMLIPIIYYNENPILLREFEGSGEWKIYQGKYTEEEDPQNSPVVFRIYSGKTKTLLIAVQNSQSDEFYAQTAEQVFRSFTPPASSAIPVDMNTLALYKKESQAGYESWIGQRLENGNMLEEALSYYERAISLNPKETSTMNSAIGVYDKLQDYESGLQFIEKYIEHYGKNQEILAWKAWFFSKLDKIDEALSLYEKIFSEGYRGSEDLYVYGYFLAKHRGLDAMYALYDKFCEDLDDEMEQYYRLEEADLLTQLEKYEESIVFLNTLQEGKALDLDILSRIINNYKNLYTCEPALKLINSYLEEGYQQVQLFLMKAELLSYLRWHLDAKDTLEEALKLYPDDKNLQEALTYKRQYFHDESARYIPHPTEEVPLPLMLQDKMANLSPKVMEEVEDASTLYTVTGVSFIRGKEYKETHYRKWILNTDYAVTRMSALEIDLPEKREITVNRVIVRNSDDDVVYVGKPEDYFIVSTLSQDELIFRRIFVPLRTLSISYSIELVYSERQLEDLGKFPYFHEFFSPYGENVSFSAIYYTGNPDDVHIKVRNVPPLIRENTTQIAAVDMPEQYGWEPLGPPQERYLPKIWITDTTISWQNEGIEYLSKLGDRLGLTDEVREIALEITKSQTTEEEKLLALMESIQKDYEVRRTDGMHQYNFLPQSAAETMTTKSGNCMDFTLLLHLMLKAVDIPSHLVLLNVNGIFDEALPAREQFDWMVLYVPLKNGIFVDVTTQAIDPFITVPLTIAGKRGFVLKPEGPFFIDIPEYEDNDTHIQVTRNIQWLSDKSFKVTENIRFGGSLNITMSDYLMFSPEEEIEDYVYNYFLPYLPSVKLESYEMKNLEDKKNPLEVFLSYSIADTRKDEDERNIFTVPAALEDYHIWARPIEDRKTDFIVTEPLIIESQANITVPPGFMVSSEDGELEENHPFGNVKVSIEHKEDSVVVYVHFERKTGEFKKELYNDFVDFSKKSVEALSPSIKIRKK